jgi:putative transposase
MTEDPLSFPWSSAATNGGRRSDSLLTPHPAYIALGTTTDERACIYRSMLKEALSDDDLHAIRIYLQQQRALGCDSFRATIEAKTRRFANVRPAHRPARNK